MSVELSVPLNIISESPACASIVILPEDVANETAPSPVVISSAAVPKPVAVPLFAIVAPESIVKVEPDKTFIAFAENLKSSAPAILTSIWSSVLA